MSDLKSKALSGIKWSIIDNIARRSSQFIIGIILARLLSPQEFGLIGMITIFIALSQTFVDGGFRKGLIRKKNCSNIDYSTIFYVNIITGLILYFILYSCSNIISDFFKEPELEALIKVLGLTILINSLTLVQGTILTRNVDFKSLAKISIIASLISGLIAIIFAYYEYGVWSLVVKMILGASITSLLLWYNNRWFPSLIFSVNSFKELFGFGSKILLTNLINSIFRNVYILFVGKYYGSVVLGYYTRAEGFISLASDNVTNVISRVSYPVLSKLNGTDKLKESYRKLIKATTFITFNLSIIIVASSESLVLTLIGEQWIGTINILQLLCFVALFRPLVTLSIELINVKGRSDLTLKLTIIKKILVVPVIIVGFFYGLYPMLGSMILISFFTYIICMRWSMILIDYSLKEQIKDIYFTFIISISIGIIVFLIGELLEFNVLLIFGLQILVSIMLILLINELFQSEPYKIVKEAIIYRKL